MEERDVDFFFLFYNIMDIFVIVYIVYQYCFIGCVGVRERYMNIVSCVFVNSMCFFIGGLF